MRLFSHHPRRVIDLARTGAEAGAFGRRSSRLAGLLSLLLAFACAESGTQYLLRLLARPLELPEHALAGGAGRVRALAEQAPRLYGAAAPERAPAPRRLRLFGVIGGGEQAGAALIGVDGRPAAVYPVGSEIEPGVRLVSTAFGRVQIEREGRRSELESEPPRDVAPTFAPPGLSPAVLAPGMPQRPLFEAQPATGVEPQASTPPP